MFTARPDGTVVPGLAPVRRIMPHLMPTRSESVVFYEQLIDVTRTLPFIERRNTEQVERGGRITLFHVVLAAFGRVLFARPGLNRFVSARRIYQRRGAFVSFAAKRSFDDAAPIATVKLELIDGEPLGRTAERALRAIGEGRGDRERPIDKEVRVFTSLPTFLLGWIVRAGAWLDRHNLLPEFLMRDDPMFTSVFVANLGSVGLDAAYHHLYEYGTCGIFATVGRVHKAMIPDAATGELVSRDVIAIRYTLDERINDGFYCARSLQLVRELVEDPTHFEGASSAAAPVSAGSGSPS